MCELWQTMADTHSPTNRRGSAVPSGSASSAVSASVEAIDGTLHAPDVPGKKDDAEKTRLRREMCDRQVDERGNARNTIPQRWRSRRAAGTLLTS